MRAVFTVFAKEFRENLRERRTLLSALLRQLRDAGHCVLFSSHVMQEVSALCDEVVVIAHGRVLEQGTPDAIRARTGTASLEEAFVRLIATADG